MGLYNNIFYFRFDFDHITLGLRYVRRSTTSLPTATCTSLVRPSATSANSYMHLPGQTIGNVSQDINIVKKKGKGKKEKEKERKRKGLQQQQQQLLLLLLLLLLLQPLQHLPQSKQPQKGSQKGKVPSGALTTLPARASTSRATRTTATKERGSLLRRPRHQSAGFVASLDIELPHVGTTVRRT